MTTQDLIDNRQEIISRISEIGNISKMKEVMATMLRIVKAEMFEGDCVIELTDDVIGMNVDWKKQINNTHLGAANNFSTKREYFANERKNINNLKKAIQK